jgi:hypothetical protein
VKADFKNFFENARKRKGLKFRNQLYVFLLCLAVSVFLWVLVRLSKDYHYTVGYNLNYVHLPYGLKLVSASDSVLNIDLKVQGYDFFSERMFMKAQNRFDVNLNNLKVRSTENGYKAYMLTNALGYEILSQSGVPHTFISTSPDTLFFYFEKKRR